MLGQSGGTRTRASTSPAPSPGGMVVGTPPPASSLMERMTLGSGGVSRTSTSPPVGTQFSFPKAKIEVLLLENIHQSAVDMFEAEGFTIRTVSKALSEAELIAAVESVHVLGLRSKSRVTPAVLAAAPRLMAVGCFCIGTDQVDLALTETRGIPVFNAPFSNTRSVAELVLAEVIALSRRLGDVSSGMHKGVWNKSASGCYEVRGKTLGIVGYGHIGSQLSIMAEALGMNVIYWDVVPVLGLSRTVPCESLEELLGKADFVTLHVPRSDATRNMIGAAQLAAMKEGSFLINASRGTVVDLDALANALRSGHLAGAAVDVYPTEPAKNGPGFESPLRGLTNVLLTPHIGGSTVEAQHMIGREVATSLIRYINEGTTLGAVNFPNLEMPFSPGTHRILNVHRNVPGVLRDINVIFAEQSANVRTQVLGTSTEIGYLIVDVDRYHSDETKKAISDLETSIKTRILY